MSSECPNCQLPKDDCAWYCDGCGLEFSKDYEAVRASLQAELRSRRIALLVTLIASAALIGVVVWMAMRRWFYISIPLGLAILGGIASAFQRISVVRGHLRTLDRRHVPLPTATVRS